MEWAADWSTYPSDPNPPQSIVWLVMRPQLAGGFDAELEGLFTT
jgi:hypothetical protein